MQRHAPPSMRSEDVRPLFAGSTAPMHPPRHPAFRIDLTLKAAISFRVFVPIKQQTKLYLPL